MEGYTRAMNEWLRSSMNDYMFLNSGSTFETARSIPSPILEQRNSKAIYD
jgi:hypothetical protein